MRVRIFAFVVAALCAVPVAMIGCGDESSSEDMATADLHAGDAAGGKSCSQIAICAQMCSGATAAQCAATCAMGGSAPALQKYSALVACGTMQCIAVGADGGSAGDGGTKPCTSATDTSAACIACIGTAAQSAACSSQLSACLAP